MDRETVLLVDDNAKLRELFRLGLESVGGMRVVGEAGDGAQGIERARELQPDVVLLDLSMPVLDGLEALGRIREASPASHVVVVTGFKADRLDKIARDLGASAFLEKGIPPTELAATVRRAIAGPLPPLRAMDGAWRQELERRLADLV